MSHKVAVVEDNPDNRMLVQALLVSTLAGVGAFILASRAARTYFGYGPAA